jgi:hypothetical protein
MTCQFYRSKVFKIKRKNSLQYTYLITLDKLRCVKGCSKTDKVRYEDMRTEAEIPSQNKQIEEH